MQVTTPVCDCGCGEPVGREGLSFRLERIVAGRRRSWTLARPECILNVTLNVLLRCRVDVKEVSLAT
jgi:hypothetical protein